MNTTEYEKHIQKEFSPDLYIEETSLEDRKRIMVKHPKGGTPIYICAVPAGEVRPEPDNSYQDHSGGRYPSQPEIDAKVKNFLEKLPDNLELYED